MTNTVRKGLIIRPDIAWWDGKQSTASRLDSTGGTIVALKIGTEVDILQVYGNGTDYTRQTIQNATTNIGSDNVTLLFTPGTWTIDDDLTIGSNFVCRIPSGVIFNVASGKTLTFSGATIRDNNTWTSGSGTVTESGTNYIGNHLNVAGTITGDLTSSNVTITGGSITGITGLSSIITGSANEYTKTQNFNATTLTDDVTIDWDLESNQVTSVTLGGNRTLNNPTNQVDGATYVLILKQDATGGRALVFSSSYKFPGGSNPVLSASANAIDIVSFISDGTNMYGIINYNFS